MNEILHLINEMSPYLLLGFLFAGLLHAFVPKQFYERYLSGKGFGPVARAALLGVPLPLCSCGVIPTAMSLRKQGASRGAVASFLIATPQTGVDSILATGAMMGWPFAVIRPLAAMVTALFGGLLVDRVGENGTVVQSHDLDDCHDDDDGCCHDHCDCCHDAEAPTTFGGRLHQALRYAFVEMVEDIGKWLVIGLVVAAAITVLVPDSFFVAFRDNTALSMLLVLAISIPMYICATGSIPIAVALMLKGLTPGAALVLLMAGPAANFASILVLRSKLGMRSLVAYLLAIVVGAVAFGFVVDYLLPREWFTGHLVAVAQETSTGNWFEWTCTAVLAALLLYSLVIKRFTHHTHQHEHSHAS